MNINFNREGLASGETTNLKLDFGRDDTGAEATLTISISFEGDWAELYGGEKEEEGGIREEVARELFGLVLDKLK